MVSRSLSILIVAGFKSVKSLFGNLHAIFLLVKSPKSQLFNLSFNTTSVTNPQFHYKAMNSLINDNSLEGNVYGCDEHWKNYEGNKLKINYIIYSTKAWK